MGAPSRRVLSSRTKQKGHWDCVGCAREVRNVFERLPLLHEGAPLAVGLAAELQEPAQKAVAIKTTSH